MGWTVPHFAHIPLIHGMDGQKLSKRHGALGAESYKEQGFLPEALLNYLLRLGWAHGDEEYIPKDRAIELFDLDGVGKSPSRFDIQKLQNLNGQYIRDKDNADLLTDLKGFLPTLDASQEEIILKGLDGLKTRAKTLVELANGSDIYLKEPSFEHLDEKSLSFYTSTTKELVKNLTDILETKDCFDHTTLEKTIREFCEEHSLKMGAVAQPLRVALTGSTVSPSVFDIMEVLGKQHSIKRLRQFSA